MNAVAMILRSLVVSNDLDQTFFLCSASIWPLGFPVSRFASQSGISASPVATKNCLYSHK